MNTAQCTWLGLETGPLAQESSLATIPPTIAVNDCFIFTYSATCGIKPSGTRIVGGTQAQKDSWPWQAMLVGAGGGSQYCGGSLIDENWVLTAAHCVSDITPNQIAVRFVVLPNLRSVRCLHVRGLSRQKRVSGEFIITLHRHHFRVFKILSCARGG